MSPTRAPAKRSRGGSRRSSPGTAAARPTPDRPAPDPALTPLQARFAEEYVVDVDATAAYRRASAPHAPKACKQLGHQMLQLPQVKARIRALVAARTARTAITADVVLGELLRIARCDIGEAFAADGTLKPLHEIPEDVRRAISGVEVDEILAKHGGRPIVIGHTKKIKFWNKVDALRDLGRHLKLFVDKVEHSGAVTLEQILAASHAAEAPR